MRLNRPTEQREWTIGGGSGQNVITTFQREPHCVNAHFPPLRGGSSGVGEKCFLKELDFYSIDIDYYSIDIEGH
jgi:hypothetical protein